VSEPAAAPPSEAMELDILRSFGIASPALVEARSLQQRFDRKYLFAAHDIACVLVHLRHSHCVLRAGDRVWARYQSVYLDTPDRELYHAHRCDRRPRFKVRIRHHVDRQLSFLEVKRKDNTGRTAKHRLGLLFGQADLSSRERTFIDAHAPLAGKCLLPCVAISFQRLTLVGRVLDERVTFDRGLMVAAGTSVEELGRVVIAEVKQGHYVNHGGAVEGFRRGNVREMALSKYCLATALVAPVPANVFKPALRAIGRLSV
jgi:hypothetical protein